jgi:enoyl-CoA hydratase/carnithine racemase
MSTVEIEKIDNNILKIWLNQPESLNAMSEAMALDFKSQVLNIGKDNKNIRAIILSGRGKAFSAGGDLEMLEAKTKLSAEENERRMLDFYNSFLSILELNIPLIAAINGAAVGAGLCLASACDIRICTDNSKLGFTFVKLGLHPGMGGTYFLPRVVGDAQARELMLTGRIIDANEALRIGLVSKVVARDDLEGEALRYANEICQNGPESIRQLVQTLRSERVSLGESLNCEAKCQSVNYASSEFKEGIRAMREKRHPKF